MKYIYRSPANITLPVTMLETIDEIRQETGVTRSQFIEAAVEATFKLIEKEDTDG